MSIEENNGDSYYYSLPNKISDYIQAKVPIVVSGFPEMRKIVETFQVGEIIDNHTEKELSEKIGKVLSNGRNFYATQLKQASEKLCWENEAPQILQLFKRVKTENFQ